MLAIVIPYFKLKFFEDVLCSLSNQTDKRFKVYIGNDNSKESPLKVIEKYQEGINIVYQKFNQNLGGISLVKQWERCLEMVDEEEWVMILGDDDVLDSNCVALFYNSLEEIEKERIDVIRFASVVIDKNNNKKSKIYQHPEIEKASDFLIRKLKGETRSSLSEYVFRKRNLKQIGFKNFPLAWYADLLAILEFSQFGNIYTINNGVVSFRNSGLNITSRTDNLKQKNIASFEFYYFLLNKKSSFFDDNQQNVLRERLEKTFLDNKKNLKFWFLFTRLYISTFNVKNYFVFMKKMFKTITHIILNR